MNAFRKIGIRILVAVFMVAMVAPALAQQGPEIQVTDSGLRADQPDVAIDPNGNVHIAFSDACGSRYQTFGASPNRYTVVEWDTRHYDDHDDLGKFQAILYEDGVIDVNILDSTSETTITGVNEDGTDGVDTGATPGNNTSHRFTWVGPDYNYTTPTYNWVDFSGGTCVGAVGDDSSGTVPIGFDFTFYGTSYDTVYVSSNGYMSFSDTDPDEYEPPSSFPESDSYAADVIAPLWSDWEDYSEREIWYTMLDNDGNTLIDDTQLTPDDDEDSTRPAIVVDSDNKVHIVWQDHRLQSDHIEVYYTKLNPYGDDRDGDAADEATITLEQDKLISADNDECSMVPRMAADSDDNLHVVWNDDDVEEIHYAKLDNNGDALVGPIDVYAGDDFERAQPDVAVDSSGNPHITFCDDAGDTDSDEVYYMMLDGSDGSTLIDAARLTPDDEKSKRPRIAVDSEDKVHITFHDWRGSEHEIYYTKLDPSLDDQDGDAADEPTITVVDDKALTPDDGNDSSHQAMAIGCGDYIHVTWKEWDIDDNVHYMVLDNEGNVIIADTALSTTGDATTSTGWTLPYLEVDANGKAHVTWCDDRTDDYEVWYTSYEPPDSDGDGVGNVCDDTANNRPTSTGSGNATLQTSAGYFTAAAGVGNPSPTDAPNLDFPHGFFEFTIEGLTPGQRVFVTITLPGDMLNNAEYWKYGPTTFNTSDHWYQIPLGSNDGDNVIIIALTDGGLGDDDLTANGVIVDQGAPGQPHEPIPIGASTVAVNKLELLAPWLGLVGLMAAAALAAGLVWRRGSA